MATPLLFGSRQSTDEPWPAGSASVDNADAEDMMEEIDAGIPVLVGWLHHRRTFARRTTNVQARLRTLVCHSRLQRALQQRRELAHERPNGCA